MTFIRLRIITPFLREADGTTHIQLSQGESLRFGRALASVLDELGRGVPELEWNRRVETDPVVARIDLALSEHHLLEQSDSLQPVSSILSSRRVGKGIWWSHVLALLLVAAISVFLHFQVVATTTDPLVGWGWLSIPIVIVATLLLHESGHYIVARLYGHSATIKMWRDGILLPRCVITSNGHPLLVNHKLLILAAGPWTDSLLLLATTAYAAFVHAAFIVRIAAICTLLNLLFNLWPGHHSDFGRIVSLAPDKRSGSWVRGMCWVLLPAMAIITLFGFVLSTLS